MNDNILVRLLIYFIPLSFATVGGGTSIVVDMHRQLVGDYHWLSDSEFLQLFALSRITPGPGTMLVSMIGWKVSGFWGTVVASIAIFLPSSLLVYFLASLWSRYRNTEWRSAIESGLAPIAAGMLLATSFALLAAGSSALAWTVAIVAAAVATLTRINPLFVLGASATFYLLGAAPDWSLI